MTDSDNQNNVSNSSMNVSLKIKIKKPISKFLANCRRSQRRRTTVLSSVKSSSSTKLLLHENGSGTESTVDTDDNQPIEIFASLGPNNQLVFTTTTPSVTNNKSSYWTVTDRQPEWYKLSIPINQSIFNTKAELVPYKKLPISAKRNKKKQNIDDQIDRPSDPTHLVMKTVMHELDYDMDDEDSKFLDEINRQNKIKKKRLISEEEFENALLILEFSTAEKIRACLKQKYCDDENIVCDICLLPDADEENEMVFCERCHCCVHQKCYGIPDIPSGTWYCKSCSILRRPTCILCPKLGGPMKCTASGTIWCHLTCALWLPELKFVDYVNMEPILHLNKIPHARWSLRCVVCSTSEGACVQCAHKNCRTPFHVTCGLAVGYFLDIQQTATKESSSFRSQFNAYCSKHSDEARKRSEDESIKSSINIDSDDDSSCSSSFTSAIPLTIYRRDQLKDEKWMNECYKKFPTFVSSSHLNEECPDEYDEQLSKIIYEYWIQKRRINNTLPLIKHIDYVFEQRESADLLIAQINTCLNLRKKMLQLQTRSKSMLASSPSSSSTTLIQRFESLKKKLLSSNGHQRGRGRPRNQPSTSVNKHKNKDKKKKLNRNGRKNSYSNEQLQSIEQDKRQCIVKLETTYRHSIELDTTYIIGKIADGQMVLLPKKLVEQENLLAVTDDIVLQRRRTPTKGLSTNASDISDENDSDGDDHDDDDDDVIEPRKKKGTFRTTKTAYTSQGNVVTCVTGSFN